jgi:membrane protease YdiL (CAAX protease family)
MKFDGQSALRDRLGVPFCGSRIAAGLELLVVPLLLGLQAAGVLAKPKLPLLLFGWLSLWLRRVGWRQVGMAKPANWPKTVLAAIVVGLAYNALDIGVILPLLRRLTGVPLDLTGFASLKGNSGMLLLLTAVSWLSAAFPEEMIYRGYVLNRLADVFGRTAAGWASSAALVSLAFGLAHHAQGVTGVLDNVLAGVLFAALYLASGRNLWLPILVHGVIDTSSVVMLYSGFLP